MMTRKTLAGLALAVTAAGPVLAADTYVVDKVHSEATFQVAHLGISKVRGRFNDFTGTILIDQAKPEASSVEFSVKTASVDTQEPKRDAHLRSADFFNAEKMPEMTFKSSKVAQLAPDKFEVTGTFTLHGVSKQITLPVRLLGFVKTPWGDERAGFEATTTINRKDYGLLWNKTLDTGGLLVGDEVAIAVNIESVKQKEAAPAK